MAPLGFFGLLLLFGVAVAILQPDLVVRLSQVLTGTRPQISPQGQADTEFANLYTRYGIKPLAASIVSNAKVHTALASLRNEPCDKHEIFQASVGLENAGGVRDAARLLQGFEIACIDQEVGITHLRFR